MVNDQRLAHFEVAVGPTATESGCHVDSWPLVLQGSEQSLFIGYPG
jgi:hypothetical protein